MSRRRPSGPGELRILIEVDIDGASGPGGFQFMDAVRLTAVAATAPDARTHAVRVADGSVRFGITDFEVNGFGTPWGHTRFFSSDSPFDSKGVHGAGMSVAEWPRLIQGTATAIVLVGGEAHYFDYKSGRTDGPHYLPRLGDHGSLTLSGSELRYTNPSGNRITFDNAGRFKTFEPAGGVKLTASYNSDGQLTKISRKLAGTDGVTEEFHYDYLKDEVYDGLLGGVTLKRSASGGGWSVLRRASYSYVNVGGRNYLQHAIVCDERGQIIDETYYHWDTPVNGRDRLLFVVDSAGMARYRGVNGQPGDPVNSTAPQPYALYAFTYDGDGRVQTQKVRGAGPSSLENPAAQGTFAYTYARDVAIGMNHWHFKTTETLPGGATRTLYANYAGLSISDSLAGGGLSEATYARYDRQGRVVLMAESSAIAGIDETGTANLRPEDGAVHIFEYYPSTTATASVGGGVKGRLKEQWVYRGKQGAQRAKVGSYLYRIYDDLEGGVLVYLNQQTVYANADGTGAASTTWDHGGWSGLFATQITTLLPIVSPDQNGPGTQAETVQLFDGYGYPSQFTDATGRRVLTKYDPVTGGLLESTVGGSSGGGWTTTHQLDAFGRPLISQDPMGGRTLTTYSDTFRERTVRTQVLNWDGNAGAAPPVREVRLDRARGWLDSRTIAYDTSAGGARTLSLERQVLDWAGRAVAMDRFQSLNEAAYEKIDTVAGTNSKKIIDDTEATLQQANFYRTEHRYNAAGLLDCTKNAVGTITQVVYDGLGRPTQTLVGLDGAMTLVSETAYDPISGLLASVTLKPGDGPDRVTRYWHDWRGRLVASKDGVQANTVHLANMKQASYDGRAL